MSNKYYWLKLKKDFFKQHEIIVVENMPNGKDYVLFYLKLLVESISHNGDLRFSDTIPYNDEMLSALTNTNVDIVRSAIKVFEELKMIEILDDGTIYMREVQNLIGSETGWAEKKRIQRGQKEDIVPQLSPSCPQSVPQLSNRDKSIDIRDKNSNNNVDFESEFSKLWERYPKKQGKNSAFTHYKSARKSGVTFEEIEKGLNNYLNYIKANKVEPRYIKNGSTWFNRCWEDSYDTIEDGTFKGTAPSYDSEKYRQAAQQPIVYKKRNNKDDVSNGGFNDLVGIF